MGPAGSIVWVCVLGAQGGGGVDGDVTGWDGCWGGAICQTSLGVRVPDSLGWAQPQIIVLLMGSD
jgi:hypothetical protein